MSNFDFLKNFNNELYELGVKLEEDVLTSPRAVTADATLFLETLVKDMYRQSNNKLENRLISFYKKIDNLYRKGVITYIYKNKLQDAYNLRNKIHKSNQDTREELKIALDLHKRLYYISKKYFQDFCANERYANIPDYKKPVKKDIKFNNCIICGRENMESSSNMCNECNQKIENANLLLSLKNTHDKNEFTRSDLMSLGISESESISMLMNLTRENIIIKMGPHYTFNESRFSDYIMRINQYIEIGLLITKFYRDEITATEIKQTKEYWRGSKQQKPCIEFYRLVNQKLERDFEEKLLETEDIKRSMRLSSMDSLTVKEWFGHEMESFINGSLNDAFITYNELLIREFFDLKRKGMEDGEILKRLGMSTDIYDFWQENFMGKDFMKKTSQIKKDLIIKEIRKNKTLNEALKSAGVSRKEFEKLYVISKNHQDDFHREFDEEYTRKRQKTVLKHLKYSNVNAAVRKSRITKTEFLKWYYKSETDMSEFYMVATRLLMKKYLSYRKNGWNKRDILKQINISRDLFNSWSKHEDLALFRDFRQENEQITSFLIKRGLIINALKEDKGKQEAIFQAGLTPREFMEIYNSSKREKTEFHIRFDMEYMKNRKRLFSKLIKTNDFYNAIEKCEISQIDFNNWYLKDQDKYLSDYRPTCFYRTVTCELMDKYIKARLEGKNKPDAARCVGLSNMIIGKWLNHPEYELYYSFKKKIKQLTIDLIVKGFKHDKSKLEVSESYDIPVSSIEEFIDYGRNGFERYGEIFELYENNIIPGQLKTFLRDIKTKSYNKAVKNARISDDDLNYYYNLGRKGDNKFARFYTEYLEIKKSLYISNIMAQKSQKIALKNSNLKLGEYDESRDEIEDEILRQRILIIGEELLKHKTTGAKLAKKVGVGVDELYGWYFKGKKGDVKYKSFYMMLEMGMIYPRIQAYNKAIDLGIPRNWLQKQLKKDLGLVDYKIWDKHGLISEEYFNYFNLDGEDVDVEKLMSIMKSSSHTKSIEKDDDPELFNFMRKVFNSSKKQSMEIINLSKDNIKVSRKGTVGK